jgi:hypothetical protein
MRRPMNPAIRYDVCQWRIECLRWIRLFGTAR